VKGTPYLTSEPEEFLPFNHIQELTKHGTRHCYPEKRLTIRTKRLTVRRKQLFVPTKRLTVHTKRLTVHTKQLNLSRQDENIKNGGSDDRSLYARPILASRSETIEPTCDALVLFINRPINSVLTDAMKLSSLPRPAVAASSRDKCRGVVNLILALTAGFLFLAWVGTTVLNGNYLADSHRTSFFLQSSRQIQHQSATTFRNAQLTLIGPQDWSS
jgi:hypothetical protein